MNLFEYAMWDIEGFINSKPTWVSNVVGSEVSHQLTDNDSQFFANCPMPDFMIYDGKKGPIIIPSNRAVKFPIEKMFLYHGKITEDKDGFGTSFNNDNGPAKILFEGLTRFWSYGVLIKITIKTARFEWYKNDEKTRDLGPHTITFHDVEIIPGVQNNIGRYTFEWNIIKGKRIPQSKLEEIFKKNFIKVDYTSSDKIFNTEADELAFLMLDW